MGTHELSSHELIGVCTDTNVIYQSVLEKKTYESQIWSVCIAKRRNVVTSWRQTPVVSMATHLIAVCKDSCVVYSVDLTEWENDNDSQNQCVSMRIYENHYKYIDLHIFVIWPWTIKEVRPFFMWFSMILIDSQWFSLTLTNFRLFSNKSGIDSHWFLNKSKPWFSLILTDSCRFSMILADSQISLELILE